MHLHCDAANHTPKSIRHLVKIFNRLEKLIYMACGVQQSRLNSYCKPNEEDFVRRLTEVREITDASINRTWFGGRTNFTPARYESTRYHALNLNGLWRQGEGCQTVEFRFGEVPDKLHAGKIKAFIVLCLALSASALTSKATTERRKKGEQNPKYAFRVAMINLGMVGDEFSTVRKHLMENVPGNSAWKDPEAAKARRAEKDEATPEGALTCAE